MNYKVFLTVLTVLTVIATLCICITQPKMHKSLLVYSSEFQIVPQTEVQVEVQNIPTVAQNQSTAPQAVKVIHFEDYKNDIQTDYQTVTTPTTSVYTQQTVTPQQTYTTTQTTPTQYKNTVQVAPKTYTTQKPTTTTKVVNTPITAAKVNSPTLVNNNPQIDLQKILDNNKKYQTTTPTIIQTTAPKPITTTQTQTPIKVATAPTGIKTATPVTKVAQVPQRPVQQAIVPKVMTPQEEEIAWQIWRSNLQNKIMQDAKLPNVPQGTIFKFTFDVDKYGKVSNIHTSCTNNPQYTPYAIQYIAPVIRAYQGRSILNFPQGSQRVTTSFVGSFKVSNSSKYSTAGDYNDTERISR